MKARFDAAISLLEIVQGASLGGIGAIVLFFCWQVGSGHV